MFIDALTSLFMDHSGAPGATSAKADTSKGLLTFQHPDIDNVERRVIECVKGLKGNADDQPMLIIDGLDLLVAATESPTQEILDTIQEWRQVHHLAVYDGFTSAPLSSNSTPMPSY